MSVHRKQKARCSTTTSAQAFTYVKGLHPFFAGSNVRGILDALFPMHSMRGLRHRSRRAGGRGGGGRLEMASDDTEDDLQAHARFCF